MHESFKMWPHSDYIGAPMRIVPLTVIPHFRLHSSMFFQDVHLLDHLNMTVNKQHISACPHKSQTILFYLQIFRR